MALSTVKKTVIGSAITIAVATGGIQTYDVTHESVAEKELKYATAITVTDSTKLKEIQLEEAYSRDVGEKVKSMCSENVISYVSAQTDSGPKITSIVTSSKKLFYDAKGDSLRPLDLTVRDVDKGIIEELAEITGLDNDKAEYAEVDAGPYYAAWDKARDYDYTISDASRKWSLGFAMLNDGYGIDITTIPTSKGIKQTYVLSSGAATTLQWKVNSSTPMIARDGGSVVCGECIIKAPVAWDANNKNVPVTVSVKGDTLVYTVNTNKAMYPITVDPSTAIVDTDDMTGYTMGGGNGIAYSAARNYAAANAQPTSIIVGQVFASPFTFVYRSLFRMDTSAIDGTYQLSSAVFKAVITTDESTDDFFMRIVAPHDTLYAAAFDSTMHKKFKGWARYSPGTLPYTITSWSDSAGTSGKAWGDTLIWNMNAAGLAGINKGGTTQFYLLSLKDISATTPSTYEKITFQDDSPYLMLTYTIVGLYAPTGYVLHTPTTTTMKASWTNRHTAAVDSFTRWTGTPSWAKRLGNADTSETITGLSIDTRYIYRVRVDSGGSYAYSNIDTLYTLANPPVSWNFTEVLSDSSKILIGFGTNSNPATTVYAIRDSTSRKWIAASGDTTSTQTWRTAAQWATTQYLINRNAAVNHRIGVVAKNGDGIQTTYIWGAVSIGNLRYASIAALDPNTHWVTNATYLTARNDTTIAHIPSLGTGEIGQKSDFTVYRNSYMFVIPSFDTALGCSIQVSGISDQSITDFRIVGLTGKMKVENGLWNGHEANKGRRYYAFKTWSTGAFSDSNIFANWSTSSYAATMKWPFSALGLAKVTTMMGDTLRVTVMSSRDSSATEPSGNEYIEVDTQKLNISYLDFDHTPSNVVVTKISKDSLLVTWTDNSATETGFALVNYLTGARLGGNDSVSTGVTSKRMGNFNPNTLYRIAVMVLGGKIGGDISTAADSCYTSAAIIAMGTTTMIGDSLRVIKADTAGAKNPGSTRYAFQDSSDLTKFVMPIAGICSLVTATKESTWVWRTYAQWGGSNGDTLRYPVGHRSAFRVYSKTDGTP